MSNNEIDTSTLASALSWLAGGRQPTRADIDAAKCESDAESEEHSDEVILALCRRSPARYRRNGNARRQLHRLLDALLDAQAGLVRSNKAAEPGMLDLSSDEAGEFAEMYERYVAMQARAAAEALEKTLKARKISQACAEDESDLLRVIARLVSGTDGKPARVATLVARAAQILLWPFARSIELHMQARAADFLGNSAADAVGGHAKQLLAKPGSLQFFLMEFVREAWPILSRPVSNMLHEALRALAWGEVMPVFKRNESIEVRQPAYSLIELMLDAIDFVGQLESCGFSTTAAREEVAAQFGVDPRVLRSWPQRELHARGFAKEVRERRELRDRRRSHRRMNDEDIREIRGNLKEAADDYRKLVGLAPIADTSAGTSGAGPIRLRDPATS
jgi:hypothetical protein